MSAYAEGRPLGVGLRTLARAVETMRRQPYGGHRSGLRRPGALVSRHATAGAAGNSGPAQPGAGSRPSPHPHPQSPPAAHPAAPRPAPSPHPAPADHPAPTPRPSPYPPAQSPNGRPSPYPGPSPHPHARPPDRPGPPPEGSGEPAEVSGWQLVTQAQAGDADAFGQLYDRYVDLVYRYIYYRVGERGTAEDFTSETFLRAWRRIGSVSNQGRDIGAWLVTIARNIVLDHVKSSRYRLEVSTADMMDADRAEDGPEGAVLGRIASTELLRCVKKLNSEQQECIVLRFLEGLSVAETAAVMGKNEGAIKALQHRAVRRLAALLPDGIR
jgi:RNA polymerase sigma-70 factor (TIGR02952 family)